MPRFVSQKEETGSSIFVAPVLMLIIVYLTGFSIDLGDAFTKADNLDQALALSAASATTQISKAAFYQNGVVSLDRSRAQATANTYLSSAMAQGSTLVSSPKIIVQGAAICIRAREEIRLPFALVPGTRSIVTYSSSSSAIAKGYSSNAVPIC